MLEEVLFSAHKSFKIMDAILPAWRSQNHNTGSREDTYFCLLFLYFSNLYHVNMMFHCVSALKRNKYQHNSYFPQSVVNPSVPASVSGTDPYNTVYMGYLNLLRHWGVNIGGKHTFVHPESKNYYNSSQCFSWEKIFVGTHLCYINICAKINYDVA
jgi:hypothetical protein